MDAIDLEVPSGAVFGFLGPNGSGKTTTIRMLLGLDRARPPGRASCSGEPMPGAAARILPRVGALVEGPAFHPYLSGRDNLARLDAADRDRSRRRPSSASHGPGTGRPDRGSPEALRAYSLGMRQRLGMAGALLRPRELLVLDEPTNGLDPQGTREVRRLVRELASEGSTIFVSSHLLTEVEQMCTHVGSHEAWTPGRPGTAAGPAGGRRAPLRVVSSRPAATARCSPARR